MRKALLVVVAVSGMGLPATMPASTAPVGGASAMINAAKVCSDVEATAWRCRNRCWWFRGERVCRRQCYRY